ncbi:ubiquitin conjugating enzyme [Histoplasma capsulatum H143]|uniref:Ubiquitin-conjugating enzyme E2 2 n=1 Tax=Ajellomyces capsulatus (strain H143) TaxID=544712 RepID=C6HER8_AJECH|nr:ubiquitin conjugating enzyme [Histoplasma capsulatum H143]
MAQRILMNEFKTLASEKWVHIEVENSSPKQNAGFKFTRPLFHPNIYQDGRLCISILHSPGEDELSGETAAERWSPAQRVESVLISILSLLDDAEVSSPANVDAGVMLRKDPEAYKRTVLADVEKSKQDIPAGFVMPTHESTAMGKKEGLGAGAGPDALATMDDEDFWVDSDADDDDDMFGGSDSDNELVMDDDDDDDDGDDDDDDHGHQDTRSEGELGRRGV